MSSITSPNGIKIFQIKAQIQCVKMEALGMRHSHGNVTPRLKKHYGLSRNARPEEVIERLNLEIDKLELP